jgi:hypothetical protein
VVSVLGIGPKVRISDLAEVDEFIRAIKICSMPFFGGEVKPSAPCRKILQQLKEPFEV